MTLESRYSAVIQKPRPHKFEIALMRILLRLGWTAQCDIIILMSFLLYKSRSSEGFIYLDDHQGQRPRWTVYTET